MHNSIKPVDSNISMTNGSDNKKWLIPCKCLLPVSSQRGSSLIEAMVSLLILGVGLLGVLSLQANGLNSGQRAMFTTEASFLAQDMASRILAYGSRSSNNNAGAMSGQYDNVTTVDAGQMIDCSAGCSSEETIFFDQNQWANAFNDATQTSLPSGQGEVLWDDDTSTYTIRIRWDQDRVGAIGLGCSGDRSSDLTCFDLRVSLQ